MSNRAKELVDQLHQETLQYIRDHPVIRTEADAMARRASVVQACIQLCIDAGHPPGVLEHEKRLCEEMLNNKRIDVKRQALAIILESKTKEEKEVLLEAVLISRAVPNNTDWI